MTLEDQLIFLFSALGGVNGLFLSVYFAFFTKQKNETTYFLSALLLVISIRVTKSAFFAFYDNISEDFIQIGLLACLLIGPFLYLHVRSTTEKIYSKWNWLIHILPIIVAMGFIVFFYPYNQNRGMWRWGWRLSFANGLYIIWYSYTLYSAYLARTSFKNVFSRNRKASNRDIWLVNIILGVLLVAIAYFTTSYTSYIVGALSFSFIFYISILLWVFRKGAVSVFFEQQEKYASKLIAPEESDVIASKLEEFFRKQEPYKNPDLKLADVAEQIDIVPNYLSQFLNDNLDKSFSSYVNEYRVRAAEEMLRNNKLLTLEAIGNECGFKSNSTFYSAFKKVKGVTPGEFKKKLT
ncbi:MAG: helix-turn-helix transcriptional regulator [Balneolaceae bacterium]|nr:helix-turn-helix transcriptional regulator [Balneolaceae bacterium]MBO6545088.1 helix-turn-helix transcriptional regulator [Balneolaceae bacterium]MBO6646484.1 helix-turn-helix transcriptional regulator [Balneolaceae bacterium]